MNKQRFTVIESQRWRNTYNGANFEVYRRSPPTATPEKDGWIVEPSGWTIKDLKTGEVGFGREPFDDKELAQSFADFLNEMPSLNPAKGFAPKGAEPAPPPPAPAPSPPSTQVESDDFL